MPDPSARASNMELGDLAPVRGVLAWVQERLDQDRALRPGDDPAVIAFEEVRRRMESAIEDARNADLEITVEQLAELEEVSRWAIYKRIARGQVPGAHRRGGRMRIPLNRNAA